MSPDGTCLWTQQSAEFVFPWHQLTARWWGGQVSDVIMSSDDQGSRWHRPDHIQTNNIYNDPSLAANYPAISEAQTPYFPASPCLCLIYFYKIDYSGVTCSQKHFLILGICPGPRPLFFVLPICTDSGIMFSQTKHGRFFEKMSFSQPKGPPEKVGGHIFM